MDFEILERIASTLNWLPLVITDSKSIPYTLAILMSLLMRSSLSMISKVVCNFKKL